MPSVNLGEPSRLWKHQNAGIVEKCILQFPRGASTALATNVEWSEGGFVCFGIQLSNVLFDVGSASQAHDEIELVAFGQHCPIHLFKGDALTRKVECTLNAVLAKPTDLRIGRDQSWEQGRQEKHETF